MRKLFFILIILGIVLLLAAAVFIVYIYPRQISPMRDYRAAAALYSNEDYVSSALQFEEMAGYRDSAQRAKQAWLAAGDKSFEEGDLAQSRTYYLKGGASSAMLEKLDSAYYQLGVKAYAADERVEAVDIALEGALNTHLPCVDGLAVQFQTAHEFQHLGYGHTISQYTRDQLGVVPELRVELLAQSLDGGLEATLVDELEVITLNTILADSLDDLALSDRLGTEDALIIIGNTSEDFVGTSVNQADKGPYRSTPEISLA